MVTGTRAMQDGQQVRPQLAPEADVLEEFAGLIEELTGQNLAQKQRDPSIPEGTVLAEAPLSADGGVMRYRKQSSMVSMGGQPLPERFVAYRRIDNDVSMLPTAQMIYQLSKRDASGQRVYSRNPWPDVKPPEYVIKTVPLFGGGTRQRRFGSEAAYETFMKAKHPDIWASMQLNEERGRRDAELAQQRELAQAILAAIRAPRNGQAAAPPVLEYLNRDGLLALADEYGITLTDRRAVEAIRAEIKAVLSEAAQ